jgi:hypothetical protein
MDDQALDGKLLPETCAAGPVLRPWRMRKAGMWALAALGVIGALVHVVSSLSGKHGVGKGGLEGRGREAIAQLEEG